LAAYRVAISEFLVLQAMVGAKSTTSSPVKGREFYSLTCNVATKDIGKIVIYPISCDSTPR
jgi:hypothetical protein